MSLSPDEKTITVKLRCRAPRCSAQLADLWPVVAGQILLLTCPACGACCEYEATARGFVGKVVSAREAAVGVGAGR